MKEEGLFDVTVGSYDGLEVCEIVGPFLFDKISGRYDRRSISLYCDDEEPVFKNKSITLLERIQKSLQKIFKNFDLEIVTESKLRIVNYLGQDTEP